MNIIPIKTSVLKRGEDLINFVSEHIKDHIQEGDVLTLSTKIISVSEDRYFPQDKLSKEDLVKQESDHYLGEVGYGIYLTIKHGLFIPSAGIDASNSGEGEYLLFPEKPFESAKQIHQALCEKFKIKNLGVILVDSHTTPLRRGTTGIALAYWGFHGVKDYRGTPDIYNKPLEYTYLNVVDSLAVMGNYVMGEGNEQIPLAIIRDAKVDFASEIDPSEIQIPAEEDLYYPIFRNQVLFTDSPRP